MPPGAIAHADWGVHPGKRQMALARLAGRGADSRPGYRVVSLAPAPAADGAGRGLFDLLQEAAGAGQLMAGFDFPIGLPRRYALAAGITSFPDFLEELDTTPWEQFGQVAGHRGEISLRRPFYPLRPGGTSRGHLYDGLGLAGDELRRRCEGTDAEILFWTLGGKQVGKGALTGWRLLAGARRREPGVALWPFDGALPELLAGSGRAVVTETYPREYYRHFRPAAGRPPRWSKRRREDRLMWVPGLRRWAESLAVTWDADVLERLNGGFSAGRNGEDEFDAVTGLLAMIGVVGGSIPAGEPADDRAVFTTEGWILGRPG